MTGSHAYGNDPFDRISYAIAAALKAMSGPGRHRHSRHARPGDFPFGPGFPFGPPPWGRGRKARRGDVRAAALVLLDEEPRNGYQLMQELERRTGGAWRPSPGSVYPALQQLEDEGLVRAREVEGGRVFELTDAGRGYVEENRAELGEPWEAFNRDVTDETWDSVALMKDVGFAAVQVMRAGDDAQREQARKVLADTKRQLYMILAEADE